MMQSRLSILLIFAVVILLVLTWYNPSHRQYLRTNKVLYVNLSGNDKADCETPRSACRSIQRTIDRSIRDFDTAGHSIAIIVARGSYDACNSIPTGLLGGGTLDIIGNIAAPGNVSLFCKQGDVFHTTSARVSLRGFRMVAEAGSLIRMTMWSNVTLSDLDYGPASESHISAESHSVFVARGHSIISGGGSSDVHSTGGAIAVRDDQVNVINKPKFWAYVAGVAGSASITYTKNAKYDGEAIGRKCLVHNFGSINFGERDETILPGNLPCDVGDFGAIVTGRGTRGSAPRIAF